MHLKSDNIEIMINDEADEVIKELFDSLNPICHGVEQIVPAKRFLISLIIFSD